MVCQNNLKSAANRAAAFLNMTYPFPDATRANTDSGRRAVADWVLNTITSDAPLHQFRKDFLRSKGNKLNPDVNFVDAFGNLGNAVAAAQRHAANNTITPMLDAFRAELDKLGVTDAYARKVAMQRVGELREAFHALERHRVFGMLKATYATPSAEWLRDENAARSQRGEPDATPESILHEATAARKRLNEQYIAGEITDSAFRDGLRALAAKYGLDKKSADSMSGVLKPDDIPSGKTAEDVLQERIDALRATPHVEALYTAVKHNIDSAFDTIVSLNTQAGKLGKDSVAYHKAYDFQHYSPLFSVSEAANINESNPFDTNPDVLRVAEGGAVEDRIPFFASLHMQLNAAAKAVEEQKAVAKLAAFATTHGKEYGIRRAGGVDVYAVTETGHSVARMTIPDNCVPMFDGGRLYWVKIGGGKANTQLFAAIKNRMTQNFLSRQSAVDRKLQTVMATAPARLFTNLNPKFWLNSAVRDPLGTLVNVALESRISNRRAVLARMAGLMAGAFNHKQAIGYFMADAERRDDIDTEFSHWMRDMAKHGGESLFNRSFYSQDYIGVSADDNVDSAVPYDMGGNVTTLRGGALATKAAGDFVLRKTGDLVTAFDMQARVSVYRALVEQGYDRAEAAAIVREFMDFSQKPLQQSMLSVLIPFFRTSTNAAYRTVDSLLYNDKGEFAPKFDTIGGLVALGFLWTAAAAAMGDDDDGVPLADKIANSKAMGNMVLGFSDDGTATSVPLPYGAGSLFFGIGAAVQRMRGGTQDPQDVLESLTIHAGKQLLPVQLNDSDSPSEGVGDSVVGAIANINPILGQAAALYGNKNSLGQPIYDDNNHNNGTLEHLQGMQSTPDMYKDMAAFLYENLGMDVHPESIAELLSNWTPLGAGRALEAQAKRDMRVAAGSDDPQDNADLWSSIVGSVFTDASPSMYSYTQYRKLTALAEDIDNRAATGRAVSREAAEFRAAIRHYERIIDGINRKMRGADDATRWQLTLQKRQVRSIAAYMGVQRLREEDWNI